MGNIVLRNSNGQRAMVSGAATVLQNQSPMHTDAGADAQANGTGNTTGIIIPQGNAVFHDNAEAMSANNAPIQPSITVVVASGAAGVATRVYVFNQDILNNVTDNTSGAASIVYTYQDGFAGRVVSNTLALARAGVGAVCYGVTLRMNITATGAGNAAGLATSNPMFLVNNCMGSALPLNFNVTSNQTRKDTDSSLEGMDCIQNVSRMTQFSFIIPALNTATLTFNFTPNFTR